MYSSILNIEWDSNFRTLNFRCLVSWTSRKLPNASVINSVIDICIFQVIITVFKDFPDISIPMIIFKTFQGLENFYIKVQDFPYFSRICMNPVINNDQKINATPVNDHLWKWCTSHPQAEVWPAKTHSGALTTLILSVESQYDSAIS